MLAITNMTKSTIKKIFPIVSRPEKLNGVWPMTTATAPVDIVLANQFLRNISAEYFVVVFDRRPICIGNFGLYGPCEVTHASFPSMMMIETLLGSIYFISPVPHTCYKMINTPSIRYYIGRILSNQGNFS